MERLLDLSEKFTFSPKELADTIGQFFIKYYTYKLNSVLNQVEIEAILKMYLKWAPKLFLNPTYCENCLEASVTLLPPGNCAKTTMYNKKTVTKYFVEIYQLPNQVKVKEGCVTPAQYINWCMRYTSNIDIRAQLVVKHYYNIIKKRIESKESPTETTIDLLKTYTFMYSPSFETDFYTAYCKSLYLNALKNELFKRNQEDYLIFFLFYLDPSVLMLYDKSEQWKEIKNVPHERKKKALLYLVSQMNSFKSCVSLFRAMGFLAVFNQITAFKRT